ncbi:hypothetical protein ACR3K2_17540 [Cryptosporidium serpentis]
MLNNLHRQEPFAPIREFEKKRSNGEKCRIWRHNRKLQLPDIRYQGNTLDRPITMILSLYDNESEQGKRIRSDGSLCTELMQRLQHSRISQSSKANYYVNNELKNINSNLLESDQRNSKNFLVWVDEERIEFNTKETVCSNEQFLSNWAQSHEGHDTPRTPQYDHEYTDSEISTLSSEPSLFTLTSQSSILTPRNSSCIVGLSDQYNQYMLQKVSNSSGAGSNPTNGYQISNSFNNISNSGSTPSSRALRQFHASSINTCININSILHQWTSYFSNKYSIEVKELDQANQYFMSLDNRTLTASTNALIYMSHCARNAQLRRY